MTMVAEGSAKDFGAILSVCIETQGRPKSGFFFILLDMWIFSNLSNWIHLPRLTHEIYCLTLEAQLDFVAEAMFSKVFRCVDGTGKTMNTMAARQAKTHYALRFRWVEASAKDVVSCLHSFQTQNTFALSITSVKKSIGSNTFIAIKYWKFAKKVLGPILTNTFFLFGECEQEMARLLHSLPLIWNAACLRFPAAMGRNRKESQGYLHLKNRNGK